MQETLKTKLDQKRNFEDKVEEVWSLWGKVVFLPSFWALVDKEFRGAPWFVIEFDWRAVWLVMFYSFDSLFAIFFFL